MNPRRLYRSRDRQLAGVAGGMAEYVDIDPTIIRIAWILIAIFSGGLALIAYLLLALVIPNAPYGVSPTPAAPGWGAQPGTGWNAQPGTTWGSQPGTAWGGQAAPGGAWSGGPGYGTSGWSVPPASSQWQPQADPAGYEPTHRTRGLGAAGIVGIVLVVIGGLALTDVVVPGIRAGAVIGPAVLLALGAALVASSLRRPVESVAAPAATQSAPASSAAEPASGSWASVPADMAPWPSTNPAPAAPANPAAGVATAAPTVDPDATSVDVATVSAQDDSRPTGAA